MLGKACEVIALLRRKPRSVWQIQYPDRVRLELKPSHVQATFIFIGYDWGFVANLLKAREGGLVMLRTLLVTLILMMFAFGSRIQAQNASPTLKKAAEFDLPGPPGKRFDYLTIDSDDHYLISAHLAAGQTYVIDLRTNKVVATVADTPGAEGVEYVSELKKFYTSNAGDNTLVSWTCDK
jgi:hypothetical protein